MTRATALQPRRTPVQRRSTATVEAIVEAAAQVFERHGYAAGTTNRIAERAGVSIGTLYQYFPNKDAILVALIERHLDEGIARLGPVLAELVEHPPPVRVGIERLLDGLLELHRHQPALHRVLFEEAPRPAALRGRLDDITDRATEAFARYLAARPEATVPDPRRRRRARRAGPRGDDARARDPSARRPAAGGLRARRGHDARALSHRLTPPAYSGRWQSVWAICRVSSASAPKIDGLCAESS